MRRMQAPPAAPLPPLAASLRPSSEPQITIDEDDEAETRLFRPQIDRGVSMRPRSGSSRAPASDERASRHPATLSRPGALVLIPIDVPSVRERSDSDVELMDSRISDPGLVHPRQRSRPIGKTLLWATITVAVLLFTAHEVSIAFHRPLLDPVSLLRKVVSLRAKL
jgi:hypothetical protein